jgi:hypothetical protein
MPWIAKARLQTITCRIASLETLTGLPAQVGAPDGAVSRHPAPRLHRCGHAIGRRVVGQAAEHTAHISLAHVSPVPVAGAGGPWVELVQPLEVLGVVLRRPEADPVRAHEVWQDVALRARGASGGHGGGPACAVPRGRAPPRGWAGSGSAIATHHVNKPLLDAVLLRLAQEVGQVAALVLAHLLRLVICFEIRVEGEADRRLHAAGGIGRVAATASDAAGVACNARAPDLGKFDCATGSRRCSVVQASFRQQLQQRCHAGAATRRSLSAKLRVDVVRKSGACNDCTPAQHAGAI